MSKKAIIWISVSAILIGGGIGGYLWWQNRPETEDDDDYDDDSNDDDVKYPDIFSGGSTGGSTGGSAGAGAGAGSVGTKAVGSYDRVRKFYGKMGKSYDNRFVVFASASDFNKEITFMGIQLAYAENWGLNGKKVYMTYYKSGKFFLKIEGMDSWIIAGTYKDGGKELKVTDAKGKWARNIGLIVDGNPAANVKEIAQVS